MKWTVQNKKRDYFLHNPQLMVGLSASGSFGCLKFYLGSEKAIGEISGAGIYWELLNTNREESFSCKLVKAGRGFWGGIVICLMICLLLDVWRNYLPVLTLVPKHPLSHAAAKRFGPRRYGRSHGLNSSYDPDFAGSLSIPVPGSVRGCLGLWGSALE